MFWPGGGCFGLVMVISGWWWLLLQAVVVIHEQSWKVAVILGLWQPFWGSGGSFVFILGQSPVIIISEQSSLFWVVHELLLALCHSCGHQCY